jgi:hypothetical protein
MASAFSFEFQLNAPISSVIELFASEKFVEEAISQSQAASWEVEISKSLPTLEIRISRTYREDWPSMVKRFIGGDLVVAETRYWEPAGANRYSGSITARVVGQPITVEATVTAQEDNAGRTSIEINGTVNSSIPFFGGQVETFAVDILSKGFEAEAALAQAQLN